MLLPKCSLPLDTTFSFPCGHLGKKIGKRKPRPTYHDFLRPFQRRVSDLDLPGGLNLYFQKGVGSPGGKTKSEGLTLPARWAQRRAGDGTRAGRRARPGRARPQARLIFMSGREAPLLHGRGPDPRARHRPLCPSLLPSALRRLHTRARPLRPHPALAAGSLRPHASAGWARWREGREPETSRALHPPAGAAPSRLRRKS